MKKLELITKNIIFGTDADGSLYQHAHDLHEIFSSATGISAGNVYDEPIYLSAGKAVSPTQAVHCLLEFKRTAVFLKGIYKAILHLQKTFHNKKVTLLYAGCGPYATLLTPLTTLFSAEEISFILLDINEVSLEAVQLLYEHLHITQYIKKVVHTDASTYQIDPEDEIQVVISETMQQALQKEPQVAIMQNLIPQLPENGLFIPERIDISAKLISDKEEILGFTEEGKIPKRLDIGMVYSIGTQHPFPQDTVSLSVPEDIEEKTALALFTDITVFANEVLTTYNCSLNLPTPLCDAALVKGKQVSFTYVMTNDPHFKYEIS